MFYVGDQVHYHYWKFLMRPRDDSYVYKGEIVQVFGVGLYLVDIYVPGEIVTQLLSGYYLERL